MKPVLEFWFEFASTYSYLSASRIEALAQQAQIELHWKPFLLGPILKNQGWDTSPFVIYPIKGKYMWRDVERRAQKYHLHFQKPSLFPQNGLKAARIALALAPEQTGLFIKHVFQANFEQNQAIDNEEILTSILQALKLAPEEVLVRSQSPAIKEKLKDHTQQAQSLGIFGSPSFRVKDELFWGDDRLEDALEWANAT